MDYLITKAERSFILFLCFLIFIDKKKLRYVNDITRQYLLGNGYV